MKWNIILILPHIIPFIQGLCLLRLGGKSDFAYGELWTAAVTESETFTDYLAMAEELIFLFWTVVTTFSNCVLFNYVLC